MFLFPGLAPAARRAASWVIAASLLAGCPWDDDKKPVPIDPPPPPPPALGTDAALASLAIDPGTLVPVFDPATTAYTASVEDAVAEIDLVASPRDTAATMTLDGQALPAGAPGRSVALATGVNRVELKVTAEDGQTTRVYTLDVTREAPAPVVTETTLQLLVLGTDGAPVDGARVTADEVAGSTLTDVEGRAVVVARAVNGAVLRLSKDGFVDQLLRLDLAGGGTDANTPLLVGMVARAGAQRFLADQAVTLNGADGTRVVLPANAFVDASGNAVSGEIEAYLTPLDVGTEVGLAAFPGGYEARGPADEPGSLITLGVADFSFEQDGGRLQLAPGVVATIDVPVYVTQDVDGRVLQANDTIPLWALGETDAIWSHEGEGSLVAAASSPSGLALRGDATHFSWWNADLFVNREASGVPGGIFESGLEPRLYCDEIGRSCESVLAGQLGAWVRATILGLDGPRRSTSRWVPFVSADVRPISIPTRIDIGLEAAVSDGYYAVDSITPDPVRSEVGGELVIADVLLKPRHLVDDGLFVPGERLRGYMTEVGEVHGYRFAGRAGRLFRLRGYPAASATAGPGISADLGASVRVWRGDVLLAEAPFDATTAAEIDVTLPADGEYRVTFTADGKLPNFYVATTALLFPRAQASGSVAFAARSDTLGVGLHVMGDDGASFVRLSPAGDLRTCLGPVESDGGCGANVRLSGWGDLNLPGWVPGWYQQLATGEIVYVSDHDRPGFADLFAVDPAEPGLATRLSGAEIAGSAGLQVVDFRMARGRPGRIVYKVGPVAVTLPENGPGALYSVEPADPEQTRRAIPLFEDRLTGRHEISDDGRWVVYLSPSPDSSVVTGDLYAVDLDAPASLPVRVNASLDYAAGERMGSFVISPDSRRVAYSVLENIAGGGTRRQAYLADLLNPGVATRISAEAHIRTMEARFAPDGSQVVYRNSGSSSLQSGGRLYAVDLADPSQPGVPVYLPIENSVSIVALEDHNWQVSPRGDQVIMVARSLVLGLSLENPGQSPTVLLRVPSTLSIDNAGWPVFTGNGDGILLPTNDLTAANLPYGLIHQRFGDPVDGYRTLFSSGDFAAGSRGVTQVALSSDGTEAVVLVGTQIAAVTPQVLSVSLIEATPPVEQVPSIDAAQGLRLEVVDQERRYQFLPLRR